MVDDSIKSGIKKPDMDLVKRENRFPSHDFSDFQHWEIRKIHDMESEKSIIERRIPSSKKVPNARFIEIANKFDTAIETIISDFGVTAERTVFNALKYFTLETKYYFAVYRKCHYNVFINVTIIFIFSSYEMLINLE